jgi:hypothetical protein
MAKAPTLSFDGAYFTGDVALSAWRGFGPKASTSAPRLMIESPSADGAPLSAAQEAALRTIVEQQDAMRDAALAALHAKAAGKSPARSPAALKPLVELRCITLHRVERDGLAYVGLSLGCTWDREHGLGAMMHGARVVQAGGADVAVLAWIARGDAEASTSKTSSAKQAGAPRASRPKARR